MSETCNPCGRSAADHEPCTECVRASVSVPGELVDAARKRCDPQTDIEVWDEAMERLFRVVPEEAVREKEES